MPKRPNEQQEAATLALPCLPPICVGGTLVVNISPGIILTSFSSSPRGAATSGEHITFSSLTQQL